MNDEAICWLLTEKSWPPDELMADHSSQHLAFLSVVLFFEGSRDWRTKERNQLIQLLDTKERYCPVPYNDAEVLSCLKSTWTLVSCMCVLLRQLKSLRETWLIKLFCLSINDAAIVFC